MSELRCIVLNENTLLWRDHAPPASTKYNYADITSVQETVDNVSAIKIYVSVGDPIDAGLELSRKGMSPLVITIVDSSRPGICIFEEICTQKKLVFCRSNYHCSLTSWFYPIEEIEVVYSPKVVVFRACEKEDFARVSPEELDLVACTSYTLTPHTIQLLLYVAAKHGHNALVFGDILRPSLVSHTIEIVA